MKACDVSLGMWVWDGTVLVGGTHEEFRNFAKKSDIDIPPFNVAVAGHAYIEANRIWLLWVEDPEDIATLAHEAMHIVFGVLQARGMTHNEGSEEAYTYTLSLLLNQIRKAKWRKVK